MSKQTNDDLEMLMRKAQDAIDKLHGDNQVVVDRMLQQQMEAAAKQEAKSDGKKSQPGK